MKLQCGNIVKLLEKEYQKSNLEFDIHQKKSFKNQSGHPHTNTSN